jgi:hypothetical protein
MQFAQAFQQVKKQFTGKTPGIRIGDQPKIPPKSKKVFITDSEPTDKIISSEFSLDIGQDSEDMK